MASNQCAICLKMFEIHDKIVELNSFGNGPCQTKIRILLILELIIPELILEDLDEHICTACGETLLVSYTFRVMAVKKQYFKLRAGSKISSMIAVLDNRKMNSNNLLSQDELKNKSLISINNKMKSIKTESSKTAQLSTKLNEQDVDFESSISEFDSELDGRTNLGSSRYYDSDSDTNSELGIMRTSPVEFDSINAGHKSAIANTNEAVLQRILSYNKDLRHYKPSLFMCRVRLETLPEKCFNTPQKKNHVNVMKCETLQKIIHKNVPKYKTPEKINHVNVMKSKSLQKIINKNAPKYKTAEKINHKNIGKSNTPEEENPKGKSKKIGRRRMFCPKCHNFFYNPIAYERHNCSFNYKCSTCNCEFKTNNQATFESHICFEQNETSNFKICHLCHTAIQKDSTHFCENMKNEQMKYCFICSEFFIPSKFGNHIKDHII